MDHLDVQNFILDHFTGIQQDFPWEDTPNASVFRHADNHKWFALLMLVSCSALHLNRPGTVYILNLKSDPELIHDLTEQPGFLPAYHMNKTHWLTILLDTAVDPQQIQSLITLSYHLTIKKYRQTPSPML